LTEALKDKSSQGLAAIVLQCSQQDNQYLLANLHPDNSELLASQGDLTMNHQMEIISGHNPMKVDIITEKRFDLPKRLGGLGLRKQTEVRKRAFVGNLLSILPRMIDYKDDKGIIHKGFMNNTFEHILGIGSFDAGNESTRFDVLIKSGHVLGEQLASCWQDLQTAASGSSSDIPRDGLLSHPVESAGVQNILTPLEIQREDRVKVITKGAQHTLSKQIDESKHKALVDEIHSLPVGDRRKRAFLNSGKLGGQFIGSIPSKGQVIGNTDLIQIYSDHLGLKSPTLSKYEGLLIKGKRLDGFGDLLTTASMTGDGHRTKHDAIKDCLAGIMSANKVKHKVEVYGDFKPFLDEQFVAGETMKTKNGLIPDFKITFQDESPLLAELKTINDCKSRFDLTNENKISGGVTTRQDLIHSEYVKKARMADLKYNHFDNTTGLKGPMELHLETYGKVQGLVLGPRGEGSPDLYRLLNRIANVGAEDCFQRIGLKDADEAKTLVMARI
jgi:hypothetical protein